MKDRQSHLRQLWKWAFLVAILGLVGCGGSSSGCSCAKPIPGGFPPQYKAKNMTQIKLTKNGLTFIEQNAGVLINTLIPGGLSFAVPQTSSGNIKTCLNGNCNITANIRRLSLGLAPPKTLKVGLWMDITSTRIQVEVSQKILLVTVKKKCDIYVQVKNKQITADAVLNIDSRNQGLAVTLGTPNFSLDSSDFKITGDLICKGIDLLKGLFKGLIEKEVQKALGGVVGDLTCMTCKAQADCPSGSSCSGGKCMQGGTCLPMDLGFSGAVDLSTLLGGLGNPTAKDLLFGINVGGRADVQTTGVELGMLGGTHAESHPCVTPQQFPPLPVAPNFGFPTNAPDGKPYMMGAAVSQIMLDKAGRSMYQNGALCIRIDSSISPDLGAAFSVQNLGALISPSLPKLVPGGDAPLVIGLRPSGPPDISIGAGTTTTDAKGNVTVKEPLIDITLKDLNFDFLVLLGDRWTRLFTYKVDVSLPIALTVKPGNKLGLVMGDLGTAMSNPRVEKSYVLAEDNQKLANGLFSLLKAVLPLATGALGNQEFALPDLQGLQLSVRGITGQEPRTDKPGRFKFLSLFADLGVAPPNKPLLPRSTIGLKLVKMEYPTKLETQIAQQAMITKYPAAVIEIDDTRPDREYSFKLNSAMWSPYSDQTRVVLENPQFLIQGIHNIQVRSRYKPNPAADEYGSGELSFHVDYTSPRVSVGQTADGLTAKVSDNMTRHEALKTEYRVNGGHWVTLFAGDVIPANTLQTNDNVEVRTIDASGNIGLTKTIWKPTILAAKQPTIAGPVNKQPVLHTPQEAPQAAMSCDSMGSQPAAPLTMLLLLCGLLIWRRRRA